MLNTANKRLIISSTRTARQERYYKHTHTHTHTHRHTDRQTDRQTHTHTHTHSLTHTHTGADIVDMGSNSSKIDKTLPSSFPAEEKLAGLTNFGNTCYANAVIQVLFACQVFREEVLMWRKENPSLSGSKAKPSLLASLSALFEQMRTQKKRFGTVSPRNLMSMLRKENEMFTAEEQHDAHEFLMFLLNSAGDTVKASQSPTPPAPLQLPNAPPLSLSSQPQTFIDGVFGGQLCAETRCLSCENVSHVYEPAMDLSLDIEEMCSVHACLRRFSKRETMKGGNKFHCEACGSLTEAQRTVKFKKVPKVLTLHLKRFKHIESLGRLKKLTYRVAFPQTLRIINVTNDCADTNACYRLFGIVVHLGSGLHHGHFVSCVCIHNQWFLCDDEIVQPINSKDINMFFGEMEYCKHFFGFCRG